MAARGLALGAVLAALAVTGCGGDDPAPFKEARKPATTTSASAPSVAVGEPNAGADALAALQPRQRRALAALVGAQTALVERGDAVANAGTDADKLVKRVDAGFEVPAGSASEVRRLSAALTAFSTALAGIATQDDLLPALSAQLDERYRQIVKRRPTVAAHVLDAKEEVDSTVDALAELRTKVDDAATEAEDQLGEVTLDADALDDAITNGSQSSTEALNGVNLAVEQGIRALADAR